MFVELSAEVRARWVHQTGIGTVAGPVLDLGQAGHRFDERLDVFPAAAAGHVGDFLRGRPDRVPVKAGDE